MVGKIKWHQQNWPEQAKGLMRFSEKPRGMPQTGNKFDKRGIAHTATARNKARKKKIIKKKKKL